LLYPFLYKAMFTNALGIERRFTFALTPALSRGERGKYVDLRNFFENPEACSGNVATKPERTRLVKSGAFHQPSARLPPSAFSSVAPGNRTH
jgi:hypothetical protein